MSQNEIVYETDTFKVLDKYFLGTDQKSKARLTAHQLESMRNFYDVVIPSIIEQNSPIICPKHSSWNEEKSRYDECIEINIENVEISKPTCQEAGKIINLYPFHARSKELSYLADVYVSINQVYKRYKSKDSDAIEEFYNTIESSIEPSTDKKDHKSTLTRVLYTAVPVMLKSKYCNLTDSNGEWLSDKELIEKGECPFDKGGEFIINGGGKMVISQERIAENTVYVFPPNKNNIQKVLLECEIKSSIDQRFNAIQQTKVLLYAKDMRIKVRLPFLRQPEQDIDLFVLFRTLGIMNDKDIFNLCLGDYINDSRFTDLLKKSVLNIDEIGLTQEDALNMLKGSLKQTFGSPANSMNILLENLDKSFLPHCGTNRSYKNKAIFLGYMVNRLFLAYFQIRPYEERDDYKNKRLDVSGTLITKIFRTNNILLVKELKKRTMEIINSPSATGIQVNKDIMKIIKSNIIESRIKYVLSTGNWSTQKNKDSTGDKGVAQVTSRIGYYGMLSHARRVHSPLDSSGSKIIGPRKLHMTHYGMCCPNETPEGQQIGVLKNLSMQCEISISESSSPVEYVLRRIKNVTFIDSLSLLSTISSSEDSRDSSGDSSRDSREESAISIVNRSCRILLNGNLIAICNDNEAESVYTFLKMMKRHQIISKYTCITWNILWKEIIIKTDGGRYIRPLYIVDGDSLLIKKENINDVWEKHFESHKQQQSDKYTITNGAVIEYMDSLEIENSCIAMSYEHLIENAKARAEGRPYVNYSHCEIHPLMMLGIVAQMIPFSGHNQSPRNIYQSSMGKQAIGCYSTNYNLRFDTVAHVQVYVSRPLVETRTTRYTLLDKLPHGHNITITLLADADNEEDAIEVNEDSINRGLFNTIHYKTYIDVEVKQKSSTANSEEFKNAKKIDDIINKKDPECYDKIDDNGVPIIGAYLDEDDIAIGKVINLKDPNQNNKRLKDVSTVIKHDCGYVDKTIPYPSKNGYLSQLAEIDNIDGAGNRFIKVKISDFRKPEVGDKFASRHSQKGVISRVKKQCDMPFDETGITPDILMNPHGIPSRMTNGKLNEIFCGTIAVAEARFQDGTPFMKFDYESMKKKLREFGYDEYSNCVMYNGKTGRQYKAQMFKGMVYYQRLKHMVKEKIHSRDTGPVQSLVRQPAEGRSRDGGHRFGEMERDVMLAHGAQKILKERLTDCSDIFVRNIDKTGTFISANRDTGLFQVGTEIIPKYEVKEVQIPYALNLTFSELYSMGIKISIF